MSFLTPGWGRRPYEYKSHRAAVALAYYKAFTRCTLAWLSFTMAVPRWKKALGDKIGRWLCRAGIHWFYSYQGQHFCYETPPVIQTDFICLRCAKCASEYCEGRYSYNQGVKWSRI